MSNTDDGFALIEEILMDDAEHYGVKGMRWGRRKDQDTSPVDVSVSAKPGGLVKTTGGQRQKQSDDAVEAAILKQVARGSSVDSLSNAQLKKLNERMNLEQNYQRLAVQDKQSRMSTGQKLVQAFIQGTAKVGQQQLQQQINAQATQQVKLLLDNK